MQLFDTAALRERVTTKPPPGAHDWAIHETGPPGSGQLIRHCSRCDAEQPYPPDREAAPCTPRPKPRP